MLLIIILLSVSVSNFGINCFMTQSWFKRKTLCDLDERLSAGCSKKVTTFSTSVVKCATLCSQAASSSSCRGSSVDENGHCFLHWNCPSVGTTCTVTNTNHKYMEKECVSGDGSVAVSSSFCAQEDSTTQSPTTQSPTTQSPTTQSPTTQCPTTQDPTTENPTTHTTGNPAPTSCHDLQDLGYSYEDHRVYIDPDGDGLNPFHVLCNAWNSVIILRNKGDTNFNRTWLEYQQGFYIDDYNVWGGLDLWVALGNAGGYKTTFAVYLKNDKMVYAEYWRITVTNATDGYKISFSDVGYAASNSIENDGYIFGDCLGPVQNLKFSTWDKDNTGQGLDCAKRAGSGWWYFDDTCSNPCNLLGWGENHWGTKPSYELFSVPGLDMNEWYTQFDYLEINVWFDDTY